VSRNVRHRATKTLTRDPTTARTAEDRGSNDDSNSPDAETGRSATAPVRRSRRAECALYRTDASRSALRRHFRVSVVASGRGTWSRPGIAANLGTSAAVSAAAFTWSEALVAQSAERMVAQDARSAADALLDRLRCRTDEDAAYWDFARNTSARTATPCFPIPR